jgi:predicted dehydrogenase
MADEVLRLGIVGGGLIAQAAHVPNVAANPRIELVALAEPSEAVRRGLADRYSIPRTYADWESMLASESLDAIVVCSPHATHAAVTLAAIDLGIHCLVEKPLCIDPADGVRIAEAARAARVVVQVGYMKRYDPGFDAFIAGLPTSSDGLLLADVTTYDPWMSRSPFVDWDGCVRGSDIDPGLLERFRDQEAAQVGAAVGSDDPQAVRAYSYTFLACLVHDVNLMHAALDRLGLGARPLGAQAWGDGRAATISMQLGRPELGGREPASGALGRCTWLLLPEQEEFSEQARLYFADAIHELRFGVPYHAQVPTEHRIQRRGEHGQAQASAQYICDTYRAELDAFIDCITLGAMNRTPPEQATRDIELLRSLFVLGQGAQG